MVAQQNVAMPAVQQMQLQAVDFNEESDHDFSVADSVDRTRADVELVRVVTLAQRQATARGTATVLEEVAGGVAEVTTASRPTKSTRQTVSANIATRSKRIKREASDTVAELAALRARYLEEQDRTDCELPGGMHLRRPKRAKIAITQWPRVHQKVKLLEKRGDEVGLLWLLRKLRRHETVGVLLGEAAPAIDETIDDDGCVEHAGGVIDLAASDEEVAERSFRPIDVDSYVMGAWDVLYERTVKPEDLEANDRVSGPPTSTRGVALPTVKQEI